MYRIDRFRRFGGMMAVGIVMLAVLVGGCSNNATEPPVANDNPVGYPGIVTVSDPVSQDEATSVRSNVQKNTADTNEISPDSALAIVRTQNPDAEVLGINLDYDREGDANYECVIRRNGKVYLVVVSRSDGHIVDTSEIQNYYYTTVIVIKEKTVKSKEIKKKYKKEFDGDVVECNLEQIDDRPTYIIVILTHTNRYVTVYVDAETGKERNVKTDCDSDDDAHKDDHSHKRGRGHYRHGNGHGYGHNYHCHCSCDDDNGNSDSTSTDSTMTGRLIGRDSARAVAAGMIDSSQAGDITLTVKNDSSAYYDVELSRDSNDYVIRLDGLTGDFISIEQTAGDFDSTDYQPHVAGDTLIALDSARSVALGQVPGTIVRWKLAYDESSSTWVYTFDITPTAGDPKQVEVDARTGAVIKIT